MLFGHKQTSSFFFFFLSSIMMYVNLFFLLRSSLLLSRSCRGGWERTPQGGKVEGQTVTDRRARRDGNEENRRFVCIRASNAAISLFILFDSFFFFPLMLKRKKVILLLCLYAVDPLFSVLYILYKYLENIFYLY